MTGDPTVSDRGPAKYFHGREGILETLKGLLDRARQNRDGTIFLVQGAPGAGKTALLAECAKKARRKRWRAAHISTLALHDPSALAEHLGVRYEAQVTQSKIGELSGSIPVVPVAGGKKAWGKTQVYSGQSIGKILNAESGTRGLLLVLDEAQMLDVVTGDTRRELVGATLKAIHNGELAAPVVLLAGGLGTSEMVFKSLGISRFAVEYLVHLGRLAAAPEWAMIRDWLQKDGGAQGDVTPWITAIAQEAHGWPQHVMAFVDPATQWLRANGGVMSSEGLAYVMQEGQRRKEAYYVGRCKGIEKKARVALASLLWRHGREASLDKTDITAALGQAQTHASAENIFQVMLHKGVLVETLHGDYRVPIPSMEDWLVALYVAPERALPPPQQTHGHSVERAKGWEQGHSRGRDEGWER